MSFLFKSSSTSTSSLSDMLSAVSKNQEKLNHQFHQLQIAIQEQNLLLQYIHSFITSNNKQPNNQSYKNYSSASSYRNPVQTINILKYYSIFLESNLNQENLTTLIPLFRPLFTELYNTFNRNFHSNSNPIAIQIHDPVTIQPLNDPANNNLYTIANTATCLGSIGFIIHYYSNRVDRLETINRLKQIKHKQAESNSRKWLNVLIFVNSVIKKDGQDFQCVDFECDLVDLVVTIGSYEDSWVQNEQNKQASAEITKAIQKFFISS